MTQREIAQFLDIPASNIEALWKTGLLRRTVVCRYRPTGAIMHSSPFDALEYGLSSGDLPKRLAPEQASLWILCLAEAIEQDDFLVVDEPHQALILYQAAFFEGFAQYRLDAAEIAAVIIGKYHEITAMMLATDVESRAACHY